MVSITTLLRQALDRSGIVQSFSGIRAGFGRGPDIPQDLGTIALAYGFCYAIDVLKDCHQAELLIGRDPRPTGQAIANELARGFLAGAASRNCELRIVNLDIITTPLMETAARALDAAGGVMITASHNPLTDNGFKFITGCGQSDCEPDSAPPGALLSSKQMTRIVQDVKRLSEDAELLDSRLERLDENAIARAFGDGEDHQRRIKSERAYLDEIGASWNIQPHCLKPLVLGPALLDPNGGAACGIGARVLEHFGVRAIEINAEIGYPEHDIDTDHVDPATGRHTLLRIARAALRSAARFGIAFDYDADRGNMVLPGLDESAVIPPQTVAAANIALALAHHQMTAPDSRKLAVVISDCTSGASRQVAEMFGAEVFIVETGEINVVSRMHQLRCEGYDVPIGVEGANGGAVFGHSTCRDGLQTAICAALGDEQPELADRWLRLTRYSRPTSDKTDGGRLPAILSTMPGYYNRAFKLQGPSTSHAEVKSRMEERFRTDLWPKLSRRFERYEFQNYEGTRPVKRRSGDESGGWRVSLWHAGKEYFIFARGSRTEAGVWRLIIDSPEQYLGDPLVHAGHSILQSGMNDEL